MNSDKIYSHKGELYSSLFPICFADSHLENTGPNDCLYCKEIGSWNGVFIGYCVNCAISYNYSRGMGFVYCGKEIDSDDPRSAKNTYLKNSNWDDIGDKNIVNSILIYGVYENYNDKKIKIIYNNFKENIEQYKWLMMNQPRIMKYQPQLMK